MVISDELDFQYTFHGVDLYRLTAMSRDELVLRSYESEPGSLEQRVIEDIIARKEPPQHMHRQGDRPRRPSGPSSSLWDVA